MRKIIGFLSILITMICLVSVKDTYAANAKINMSTNKKSVNVNDVIEICINIESDIDIKSVKGAISYDSTMLEFVTSSQTISKANGYLKLEDTEEVESESRTYIIEFKALKKGITQVDFLETPTIVGTDNDKVTCSYTFVYVEISGEEDKDATLESLRISPGTLNRKFSPEIFEYSMTVDNSVTEVVLAPKAKSDIALVTVTGDTELKVGTTKVKIVVEAEAGNKEEYIIKVKRRSEEEQKEKEKKDDIARRKKRKVIYKEDKYVYIENDSKYEVLEIVDIDAMKLPIGYEKIKLDLYGVEISACVLEENKEDDIILIYAKNTENGYEGYYSYDKVEKTIQRYFGETLAIAGDKSNEAFEKQEYEDNIKKLGLMVAGTIVLLIISLIIIIKLYSDLRTIKNDNYLV